MTRKSKVHVGARLMTQGTVWEVVRLGETYFAWSSSGQREQHDGVVLRNARGGEMTYPLRIVRTWRTEADALVRDTQYDSAQRMLGDLVAVLGGSRQVDSQAFIAKLNQGKHGAQLTMTYDALVELHRRVCGTQPDQDLAELLR